MSRGTTIADHQIPNGSLDWHANRPYEILAPLGAGGMGEVYRAHDLRLERAVAIKVLKPSSEVGPRQLRRFQLEAKAIARPRREVDCRVGR